jgi:hypothetical protein
MSATAKKTKSMVSAKRRARKPMGTALQRLSGRTKRIVRSRPVRVVLGAAAIGFVIAKLRHLV